jgi:ABC-2 type transport system ATP-binding protein
MASCAVVRALLIRAVNVSKRFGEVLAVDNVSLEIPSGSILGMIGPNGSGKTTLIRMMVGILRPSSDACFIGEKRADLLSAQERATIGYMTQQKALSPDLTARENLQFFAETYGVRDSKKRVVAIDEAAKLTHITEYLDRPVEVLSGGTVQRLSLACTIVHGPDVIFLDEPTVGVSPGLRAEFWEYFQKLAHQGRTIVMTTHYLEEASHCDSVMMIFQGRLIAHASPNEIVSSLPLERSVSGEVSSEDVPRLKRSLEGIAANEVIGNHFKVVATGDETLFRAIQALYASGIRTHNMVVRQPGLEEAFTHLAGREG